MKMYLFIAALMAGQVMATPDGRFAFFQKAARQIGGTGWTPIEITGLTGWWDASDVATLTLQTNFASIVADKSGLGNNATNSGTSRPTYGTTTQNGINTLFFDGADDFLTTRNVTNFFTLSDWSYIVVAKADEITTTAADYLNDAFFSDAGGYVGQHLKKENTVIDYFFSSASIVVTQAYATNVFGIFHAANGGAGTNNVFAASINGGTTTNRSLSSIHSISGAGAAQSIRLFRGGQYTKGEMAEILFFNNVISTTDQQKAEGYLAHKWGLTATLPVDHPYKGSPP